LHILRAHTTLARARTPRAPTLPPHRVTHHVLALQQLLGDDRGQSTEEVALSVNDDNLRARGHIRSSVVSSRLLSRRLVLVVDDRGGLG
jgi:hypothetical protein